MATLSLSLPAARLIDEAIAHYQRTSAQQESLRRNVRRLPEPQAIGVRGVAGNITVKIASQLGEWEQAFRLVAGNYQEAGYQAPTGKPFRFTPYHALPDTTVFVAKRDESVVATFTLVADNTLLGLPLEALYAAEVGGLRRQGCRLAEVTSLAFADLSQREFLQVFTAMIRLMKQYHVGRGGDTWVITVNPRHRNFYCKVLGYQSLGPCKAYAAVSGAPAEAFWLDRGVMRTNAPRGHEQIFGEGLPAEAFHAAPLPRSVIRYFAAESSQTDETQVNDILRSVAAFGTPRAW
jgi:hypothetical protein